MLSALVPGAEPTRRRAAVAAAIPTRGPRRAAVFLSRTKPDQAYYQGFWVSTSQTARSRRAAAFYSGDRASSKGCGSRADRETRVASQAANRPADVGCRAVADRACRRGAPARAVREQQIALARRGPTRLERDGEVGPRA